MPAINEAYNQGVRMATMPTVNAALPTGENLIPVEPADSVDDGCGGMFQWEPKNGWLESIIFGVGMVLLTGALGLMMCAPVISMGLMTFTLMMTIVLVASICFLTISRVV